MRNKSSWIALVFFTFSLAAQAQGGNDSLLTSPKRLPILIASESIAYGGAMIGLNALWYADYERSSFHFFNDNREWLQIDKAGHFMTAYYLGAIGYDLMKWANQQEKKSIYWGGSLGLIFLTTVEVFDGFSKQWGASSGDLIANTLGTAFFVGQQLRWGEQKVILKFSAQLSSWAEYRPELLGENTMERLLKDYNGQTYWASANIASLLNAQGPPSWLNIAFGYGGERMLGGNTNPFFNESGEALPAVKRYRQYYLSPDVDFSRIPTRSKWVRTALKLLNFVKIPAPTIEWNQEQGARFHLFYF